MTKALLKKARMVATWLGVTGKKKKEQRVLHRGSKVKIEKHSDGRGCFLNSCVSTARLLCKYTRDSDLCTTSHFREALGFLFSLHFTSGQPATF